MRDDKKRDRTLQLSVRERQNKTGESYQAAWRSLTASEAPNPSNTTSTPKDARRVPLSLSTPVNVKILPGQSAQVTVRPQLDAFWPERLLIKNAERWDIHQLTVESWTGSKASLIEADSCDASAFSLDAWHPLTSRKVRCGEEIVAVVTYTGSSEQGEGFEAALFGWESCPPTKATEHHDASASERVAERAESKSVLANKTIKLSLTLTSPALFVDRLTIADAKDWIVNDIRTRGKSIFVQAGELPGEMFLDSVPVILEPLAAKDRVEIVATYIGNNPSARLVVDLSGTTKLTNAQRTVSYFLPMSTRVPILSTQSAQITARPQRDFLPERLVIAHQDDWIVNDIMIGIRCQLAANGGDLPGQSFAGRTVGSHMTLDPVHVGQDFVLVTTRGEDCKESALFFCGVQGRLVQAL
jgi:hypothetical protein